MSKIGLKEAKQAFAKNKSRTQQAIDEVLSRKKPKITVETEVTTKRTLYIDRALLLALLRHGGICVPGTAMFELCEVEGDALKADPLGVDGNGSELCVEWTEITTVP